MLAIYGFPMLHCTCRPRLKLRDVHYDWLGSEQWN